MDYSNPAGVWQRKSRSTWCSGFAPGMFWYMYDHTGEEKWRTWAKNWTNGLRARATEADNDTGFQIYCSFGNGYLLSDGDDADFWNVMQTAAQTFATQRYNPTIGAYRAWTNSSSNPVGSPSITANTTNPNAMVFEVNIDMMTNLELPLFVGKNGGDSAHVDRAVQHADTTWEDLIRSDGSSIHVIGYKADGSVDYPRATSSSRSAVPITSRKARPTNPFYARRPPSGATPKSAPVLPTTTTSRRCCVTAHDFQLTVDRRSR